MKEVELKFLVEKEVGRTVWDRAIELGFINAEPPVRELESIYYDTAGNKLRKAGISLRLRRVAAKWMQTVKYDRELNAGLSRADEIEVEVPDKAIDLDAIKDKRARKRLEKCIGDAAIEPVCWTLVNRRADELMLEDGSIVELALDIGLISAGAKAADFCEVEIELVSGKSRSLYSLADKLFPDGGMQFSRYSKAQRGFMLAEKGVIEPAPVPRRAKKVVLDKDKPVLIALRDTLRECIDQISLNIPVVRTSVDPAGPHQLRIGLRRLRALFVVYSKVLDRNQIRRLSADSRWLFAGAGELRDIDSTISDHIRPLMVENATETGFEKLIDALERHARYKRASLRTLLSDIRTQGFLLDLSLMTETLEEDGPGEVKKAELLDQPLSQFAAHALDKLWKKARKRGDDLSAMEITERHELRKDLKKLRYTVEFFAPIHDAGETKAFLRRLKDIQTVLGDVVDVSSARRLFLDCGLLEDTDPDLQRAIGWVMGSGKVKARAGWDRAEQLWSVLGETKPFWH